MARSPKPNRRTAVPPFLRIEINRELTERRFDQFESYALSLEGMLRRQAASLSVKLEAKVRNMPEPARQDYIDAAAEDYAELQETFPAMFRASLFVMCLADFEHTLNGLAELFQHAKKLELSFKEIRGEGMDRARLYLKKVVRVGFPDDSPLWPQIKAFSALRNVLVHAGGRLPPDHKDRKVIHDLIKAQADKLRLDRYERIVLEREFVPHVLTVLRKFHGEYAGQLKERYRISMFST
jgi:hypothetical protein